MKVEEIIQPDAVYRMWDSTKDIIEFADWLPEVVGNRSELVRIGSAPIRFEAEPDVTDLPTVPEQGIRFIDADVTKYRTMLSFFRKRHSNSTKNKQ